MEHPIGKITSIIAVIAVIALSSEATEKPAASEPIRSTSKDFEEFLASLPTDDYFNKSLTKLSKKRTEPIFVFIPGIFGSKLVMTKENKKDEGVWGCINNTIFVSKYLNYDVAPKLTPKPLLGPKSSVGDCAFPTYEKFFNTMTYSSLAGKKSFFNFAYDWRQSNKISAQDLDAFIRNNIKNLNKQKVVFVAHSMGGLVFKW